MSTKLVFIVVSRNCKVKQYDNGRNVHCFMATVKEIANHFIVVDADLRKIDFTCRPTALKSFFERAEVK